MTLRERFAKIDSNPWDRRDVAGHLQRGTMRRLALMLAGCVISLPSGAHDFWIEPDRFVFDAPAPVSVTLRVGQQLKGESVPYISDWIDRFEIDDADGRRTFTSHIGDDPAGISDVRSPGATWIAYQSRDDFVELPSEKFRDYLLMEGMDYILPLREQRDLASRAAREYYVRCVKSLLWWPGSRAADVSTPLGLTLEIVPLGNPYTLPADRKLDVQLLYEGRPAAGLLVKAFTRESPQDQQLHRTDEEGRARLQFDRPGQWIIKTVHMVAVDDDPYGDWRSYWASLTFSIDE